MKFIPLMRVNINEEDIKSVETVLRSGMLVQGTEVLEFEKKISSYTGCKEAVAVSNGTASLHLSLIALGIKKGDEVIVPALSYIATVNVVELVGATPVFVDINLDSFNIDTSKIKNAITPKTKAIIPVHEFGLACNMSDIAKIAKEYSLFIIEDAACALGAKENNKHAGTSGNAGSFSFHPRKAITSGEGGIITTNDSKLANKLRTLRNHGISVKNEKVEFTEPGFNYRLTDIQAALLNSQFKRFNKQLKKKNEIATYYLEYIKNDLVTLPSQYKEKTHSWQTFHLILDKRLNRENIIEKLKTKGIGSNYGAQCLPLMEFYQKKYKLDCSLNFPNALHAYNHGLAIPLYDTLNIEEIKYIVEEINNIEL